MKKIKVLLLSLFFLPLHVFAYSNYIIPGGDTIGIEINSDGIMVIGFYEVNGKYNRGNPSIKSGDYITKINDIKINSIKELTKVIEDNVDKGYVNVTLREDNEEKTSVLDLIYDNGIYKTGLFVKENITGIGTLTYIDPETKIFGALGHEIVESNTNSIVEIKSGKIFNNEIISIDKSRVGIAGSKNAKFYYNSIIGTIYKNTNMGIFGNYSLSIDNKNVLEVANENEVELGKAYIYTVLKNNDIEKYEIEIIKINETSKTKNITFKITDNNLLDKTGGVIQGMSGSPIIQNNKIIGAITHVIVDNPVNGYGIFIKKMLEEGEK